MGSVNRFTEVIESIQVWTATFAAHGDVYLLSVPEV
jgi:hypothetical protein